jgi:hypothetical protein
VNHLAKRAAKRAAFHSIALGLRYASTVHHRLGCSRLRRSRHQPSEGEARKGTSQQADRGRVLLEAQLKEREVSVEAASDSA